MEKYSVDAADLVYVEHKESAIESARSMWINTYHYDASTKDLVALKTFLDDNL